jgi:sugar/nucleoside kinase (ribokinase family)
MSCSWLLRPLTVWLRDPNVAGTTLFPERAAWVSADDPAVAGWDVQVAGHLCVDLVPRLLDAADVTPGGLIQVGPLDLRLGGCVGNTGPDLAALGLRTLLVTSLGDDVLAGTVAALIDAVPAADARVEIVPGATTSYSVVVQPPGTDRTFWHHVGANASFDGRRVDVGAAPLLHVGYLPLLPRLTERAGVGLVRLFEEARSASVTTSMDMCVVQPGRSTVDWADLLTRVLPLCDVVSPSLDDMRSALAHPGLEAAEAAEWLLERGAAVVAVSDGARGLVVRTAEAPRFAGTKGRWSALLAALPESWHDRQVEVPATPVPVVQTTGAGDAATAALLASLHSGGSLDQGLELVQSAAAHRVAGRGSLAALHGRGQPTSLQAASDEG